jgi:hypothetical protein
MAARAQLWIDAMRAGHFERAWALSMDVLCTRDPTTRDDSSLPYHQRWLWDGTPVDDRDVLVRCYHGLGDTIQFARFLPLLAKRAASLTLEVQPCLIDLLATVEGIARALPFDHAAPAPRSDCDIEISELDLALRAEPHQTGSPYLHTAPTPLPPGTIAFCYRAGAWDDARSIAPEQLAPLCRDGASVTLVPEPTTLDVLNPEGCPFDITATAGLVAGAALIITVDTMIAHLAGALGKRTWLLLKAEPDWRWNPVQTTSPWYPSLRLYAQPDPGDWASVITRVEHDLAATSLNRTEEATSWRV